MGIDRDGIGGEVMDEGWIRLHRKLLTKAVWLESTAEQKVILITLLLMANHKENEWEWQGKPYKAHPGQLITSLDSIQKSCGKGISLQNIRTALVRFEKYGFLTNESTNKNRRITIENWAFYQDKNSELTKPLTSNSQATNRQLTTNKNDKECKNEKNKKILSDSTDKAPSKISIYQRVIGYLNQQAKTKYRYQTKSTQQKINARLAEGFCEQDFYTVVDKKVQEWLNDAVMQQYLRPETLFGTKFEGYLNQSNSQRKPQNRYQAKTLRQEILPEWVNAPMEDKKISPERQAALERELEELLNESN